MKNPFLKFYPTDWRSDPALRMCSPAARGVWIDMICLMHEATPYGHLLVNGRCPTDAQIAVLLGLPPDQFSEIQGELEAAGVFSRTKDGVIYSRKMTRMAKKSATARRNGRKGGNPRLSEERGNPSSDNPLDKGRDMPQKPEARSQSPEDTEPYGSDGEAVADFLTETVWKRGVPFLCERGVKEGNARSMIGKWLKSHSVQEVHDAFVEAKQAGTGDPIPYITEILKPDVRVRVSDVLRQAAGACNAK